MTQILTPAAQAVCRALVKSGLMNSFYLAGGTGLALQLKHRISLDLDFFLVEKSDRVPYARINRELEKQFNQVDLLLQLRQFGQTTFTIRGTKTTFLAYPFPLLYPLVTGSSLYTWLAGISIADLREIAAMKAYALGRRATFRDYIDLYYLLNCNMVTLSSIIRDAQRKYRIGNDSVFSAKLFLEQLCYFDDLPDVDATLRLVAKPPNRQDIEDVFNLHVRRYLEEEAGLLSDNMH